MKIPIDLFIKSYFMMDVFWVFCLIIVCVEIIFFIIIKHKEYNKLLQEYKELVDEFNQLAEVNFELRKEIKASLNRQLLDFFIGNCKMNDK